MRMSVFLGPAPVFYSWITSVVGPWLRLGACRDREPLLPRTEFTEAKRYSHRTLEAVSGGEPLFSPSCFTTDVLISLLGMHTKGSGREI